MCAGVGKSGSPIYPFFDTYTPDIGRKVRPDWVNED